MILQIDVVKSMVNALMVYVVVNSDGVVLHQITVVSDVRVNLVIVIIILRYLNH